MKPHSAACDRNQEPILAVLRGVFGRVHSVLEIGSGTGQHAVFFGRELGHLLWQTSDLPNNHEGIRAWLDDAGLENVRPPVALDVCSRPWPIRFAEAAFTANTIHIVSAPQVVCMFEGVAAILEPGAPFCTYGPFTYDGRHTSQSNEAFDSMLRERDPESGIKDMSDLNRIADGCGLHLEEDHSLPSNNRLLVWRKA